MKNIMKEIALKHSKNILGVGITLLVGAFVVGSLCFTSTTNVSAAENATTDISATVEAWVSISVASTSMAMDQSLVNSAGNTFVGTASTTVSAGTNEANGWSMTIAGANGGLLGATEGTLISTVGSKQSLSAGTDGYGAYAANTYANVTASSTYDGGGGSQVGPIASSASNIASASAAMNSGTNAFDLVVKAASATTTPADTYNDTITLTITPTI